MQTQRAMPLACKSTCTVNLLYVCSWQLALASSCLSVGMQTQRAMPLACKSTCTVNLLYVCSWQLALASSCLSVGIPIRLAMPLAYKQENTVVPGVAPASLSLALSTAAERKKQSLGSDASVCSLRNFAQSGCCAATAMFFLRSDAHVMMCCTTTNALNIWVKAMSLLCYAKCVFPKSKGHSAVKRVHVEQTNHLARRVEKA